MARNLDASRAEPKGFWFDGYGGSAWRGITMGVVGLLLVGLIGVKIGQSIKPAASAPTASSSPVAQDGKPVPKAVLASLESVSKAGVAATGAPLLSNPAVTTSKLWTVAGKPVVLYLGADYCPYCAAERWAMITAFSRFGTFSNLHLMTSSASDVAASTPTFTFYNSRYKSPYIDLQTVELSTNKIDSSGNYPTLQTPTALQSSTLQKYDAPPYVAAQSAGSIPFVDIANRYIQIGAAYNPALLDGQSWTQIAHEAVTAAKTGQTSGVGAQIVRAANVLTAAICKTDGGKPANVCTAKGVLAALPGGKAK